MYDHVHESVSLVARKCYLFLELLALFGRERVCFCDQRDDLDLLVQPLHELDVQRLQPATGNKTFTFRSFSRRFLNKATYICQRKEKQQYINFGTVRMFIEPRAGHQ